MTKDSLKLLFAGDFCAYAPEILTMGNELQGIINGCDLNLLNFEGPLQRGQLHAAGTHFLKQSELSPQWCIEHGFNIIGLANNHAYDFGEEGLEATKASFKNVATIGCGLWDEVYSVRYIELKGKRLGFFAVTSADLSSLKDKWTDWGKCGCAWINHGSIENIIREAKKECDYLFVLPHAGVEFMDVPLPEWRDRYYILIDAGADAIIASHPHVPQGWETYHGKPIFYSLGNFVFDKGVQAKQSHWNNGIVVCLEISDNLLTVKTYAIILQNHCVDIDHSKDCLGHINNICSILHEEDKYMSKVNECVLYMYSKYEDWLISGLCRPLYLSSWYRTIRTWIMCRKNKRIALHQLREESTRWTLIRAYKLLSNTDL